MTINLVPKQVLMAMLAAIAFLLCMNSLGIVARIGFDRDHVLGLINLFDFNTESNIPTLYSTLALLLSSLLLLTIANMHRQASEPFLLWALLAVIFAFLTIDEIHSIHESLTLVTRSSLNTSGLLHYAWVIPYGIAVLLILVMYFRFLLALPKK